MIMLNMGLAQVKEMADRIDQAHQRLQLVIDTDPNVAELCGIQELFLDDLYSDAAQLREAGKP